MDDMIQTYRDTVVRAVSDENEFAYHRVELEAEESYAIDFWKDGAIARGAQGFKLKDNPNPGVEIAIEAEQTDIESYRERIEPGRSSETSHYADIRDLDGKTLAEAAESIAEYLEKAGEPEDAGKAVREFFKDVDEDLLG